MQTTHRPVSPSADETRCRILAAAKAIYECNGTRGTTTREVAERAGVNEATLFRHFGNKQALLSAMRESACLFGDDIVSAMSGDLTADLRRIMTSLIERMFDRRAMMCISMAEEVRGEGASLAPEWRGPVELRARLGEYFARLVEKGEIQGDPDRMAVYLIGVSLSYVLARKLWNSDVAKPDDVAYLVDIFLNGVR